jgi:hypothetical protein
VHTNPVLICFCSILYYRDLAEHIKRYRAEKEILKTLDTSGFGDEIYFSLKPFIGKLINESILKEKSQEKQFLKRKSYQQLVLNRWHVLLRLALNKELIKYRRHNLHKKNKIESVSLLKKIIQMVSKKISLFTKK